MKTLLFYLALAFSMTINAQAAEDQGGLPHCDAEVRDEMNTTISKLSWRKELFLGSIKGATQPILISTSLGNEKVMSLWVRDQKKPHQNGMFSFVDLSTGRAQFHRFYMEDGFSVQVTCVWHPS